MGGRIKKKVSGILCGKRIIRRVKVTKIYKTVVQPGILYAT